MNDPRAARPAPLRLAVIVASAGRPIDIAMLLHALAAQSRHADRVVLAVPGQQDAPPPGSRAVPATVVLAPRGLPAQRNAGLRAVADCDAAVFFDDDFLPAADYLARIEEALAADPSLLAVDGRVVADGARGPGFEWQAAALLLEASKAGPARVIHDQPDGLYGCNMTFRLAGLGDAPFDERLPLYAWLEDYDLSRRIARRGRIGRVMGARGIHLGVKRSRTSGLRLGYSQIANPLYLAGKGTMPRGDAVRHLVLRPLANVVGLLRGDRHVDRLGRLRGNVLGLVDAALGRIAIDRILRL